MREWGKEEMSARMLLHMRSLSAMLTLGPWPPSVTPSLIRSFPPSQDLHAINVLLPEQTFGPDEQEQQRHHIGEPALDAAADHAPKVDFGQFFRCADDQSTDDGAGNGLEPAQDQHWKRFECNESQCELHTVARAP